VLGVNSRLELSEAQRELQLRRNEELMEQGVSMISPETIRVSADSLIGRDTKLAPCVHIFRGSQLGTGCTVEQGTVLENCTLGNNVSIGAGCCLVDTVITDGMVIGPHSTNK
jgi:bifunctional UDP-N-acetylglucosamine pyrophosphorylase/glucosamine-1-phosphate N-acetyltransferase